MGFIALTIFGLIAAAFGFTIGRGVGYDDGFRDGKDSKYDIG